MSKWMRLFVLLLLCSNQAVMAQQYPAMVNVSGGTFNMGNEATGGEYFEKPVHAVTLSDFAIGKTPVTVAQWKVYSNENNIALPAMPSWGWKDDHPMTGITWSAANAYCQWLSDKTGDQYRLPTEAEWEFAARGGNRSKGYLYSGSGNINEAGWYKDNSGGTQQPVAKKIPNELGLYDMSGNVWQYCSDWLDGNYYNTSTAKDPKGPARGDYHVLRGGGYAYPAVYCRVAARMHETPGFSTSNNGFRVVKQQADAANAKLQVADILQSNMVVQQAQPFRVWGKSKPGENITINASWNSKGNFTANDKGEWWGEINVPKAKTGDYSKHNITISTKDSVITLRNLLIGEVWLCSGQSNMEMTMFPVIPWHEGVENYEREIASANFPNIRIIKLERKGKPVPQFHSTGKWEECSPLTVPMFSGTAYYFGRKIQATLNIPVGLVVSAYGGSSCQAWTSKEVLAGDPLLKGYYLDKYEGDTSTVECLMPYTLYNSMIHPLRHLSIKGFLWDQGASNGGDGTKYTYLNTVMINSWRADFAQGDLPFYFVQGASFDWGTPNAPERYEYAIFKEAQTKVEAVKNTAMILPVDLGESDNIHPRKKKPVGERLALVALAKTYQQPVKWEGPRFDKMFIDKDIATIRFQPASIGDGLTTNDGKAARHFFIAGADKIFYPAVVEILNGEVRLQSAKVKNPVAVRYAFTNFPFTNFANKNGLPAYPFRTDNW